MSMNVEEIKRLIDVVKENGISELEVREGESLIRIKAAEAESLDLTKARSSAVQQEKRTAPPKVSSSALTIESPMAGTFYRSPAPELPPFVEVGQRVEIGDVLCIIESMKMMNEIKSERIGTIVDAPIQNGQAIASGTPIFYIN